MPSDKAHPRLVLYGDSVSIGHSLILVVGREPNDDCEIGPDVGLYDFDLSPKCSFWNISYGFVASVLGLKTAQLKSIARNARLSPIAYADVLPITIPDQVGDKSTIRAGVSAQIAGNHVATLLGIPAVRNRVKVVLLSGHESPPLAAHSAAMALAFAAIGVPSFQVPFFYGTNAPRLREAMTQDLRSLLRPILAETWPTLQSGHDA